MSATWCCGAALRRATQTPQRSNISVVKSTACGRTPTANSSTRSAEPRPSKYMRSTSRTLRTSRAAGWQRRVAAVMKNPRFVRRLPPCGCARLAHPLSRAVGRPRRTLTISTGMPSTTFREEHRGLIALPPVTVVFAELRPEPGELSRRTAGNERVHWASLVWKHQFSQHVSCRTPANPTGHPHKPKPKAPAASVCLASGHRCRPNPSPSLQHWSGLWASLRA